MQIVIGYEKLNKYNQVNDIVLKREEGKYKVVQPRKPNENINLAASSFIDFDHYREKGKDGDVQLRPFIVDSDGREYVAMGVTKTKPRTIFRLLDLEPNEEYYLIRVHEENKVLRVEKSTEVPQLFRNEEGHLEMEEPRDIEHMEKVVNILTLTSLEGEYKPLYLEELKKQLPESDLLREIVKETGNTEIALAVSSQALDKEETK